MGPTWVLSAPDGPHVGPMNLAIREASVKSPRLNHRRPWLMMTSSNGNIFRITSPLCGEFTESPVNSPHKGQWLERGALMLSLIYAWTNGWVNNRDIGDLRRHRAHHDVTVMHTLILNPATYTSVGCQCCGKIIDVPYWKIRSTQDEGEIPHTHLDELLEALRIDKGPDSI